MSAKMTCVCSVSMKHCTRKWLCRLLKEFPKTTNKGESHQDNRKQTQGVSLDREYFQKVIVREILPWYLGLEMIYMEFWLLFVQSNSSAS